MMEGEKELNELREQVREVTSDIVGKVQRRMDLARRIGEIKNQQGIEVRDEKVEQDVRSFVRTEAKRIGMNPSFALRLLNLLLEESEHLQGLGRQDPKRQTHLGIFMKARELEASGKKMIHMEVGEPDYSPPSAVGDSLSESFRLKRYHYTETRGISKLRGAISEKEGVPESKVIVTPGGRFAVFSAIASLLRTGDELIVIEPAWPAYKECADFVGAKTRTLKTTLESSWTPDLTRLEELIGPATRMIAINYPNNPTGKVLDDKTLEGIFSIAKENDLYVLSDEVYSHYCFERPFSGALHFGYGKSIVVSSFSKRYAMTGFRVGYAIAEEQVIKGMNKVQAVGVTSVAEPMQYAALAALADKSRENVESMKKRIDFVCSRLDDMALRFAKPDGALYVYPEIRATADMALVERLLDKGLAVAPGSGFGDTYSNFIRISACQPMQILEEGMDKIESEFRELS